MAKDKTQKLVNVRLTAEHARIIYLLATRDESYDWFGQNVEEILVFDGDPDDEDEDVLEVFDEATDSLKQQLQMQGVDLEGPS